MRLSRFAGLVMLLWVLSVGCQPDSSPTGPGHSPSNSAAAAGRPRQYLLGARGGTLPADLGTIVAGAGGTIVARVPEIGLAVVRAQEPGFRVRIEASGLADIAEDVVVPWHPGDHAAGPQLVANAPVAARAVGGGDESFYGLQWAPASIHAPEAWAAGYDGRGVRVAIVDGGIHSAHVDLAPNLDLARSASFALDADGNTIPFDQDVGTFWHGTHVAGIVAAADNGIGTIGIAPRATIIGVKVLDDGRGSFGAVAQGIVYAATPVDRGGAGADIINLSLGASLAGHGNGDEATAVPSAKDAAQLRVFLGRATTYAYRQGAVVIAAAGNDGIDLDHTGSLAVVPAQSPHVLAVSALGPLGWALGFTGFDRPASYSNFGQSVIAFGAPGGDFALPGNDPCSMATLVGVVVQPCWVFDMVLSAVRGGGNASYGWAAGTSMAAPAAAGVAALIVGKFGRIGPAQVEARLRSSADDLGKPGNDDAYGMGRVNAFRAIQ
ncbi:MAG TPA: S8 family serine peptidase [Gemmatimonadales bacterium]